MKPAILQIAVGQMANFTYIVADEENGEAAVIDPSWDLDKIFQTLKKNNWRPSMSSILIPTLTMCLGTSRWQR